MLGRVLIIYLLFTPFAQAIIEPIECGNFDETSALTKEQNKSYPKAGVKYSIISSDIEAFLKPLISEYKLERNEPNLSFNEVMKRADFAWSEEQYEAVDDQSGTYLIKRLIATLDNDELKIRVAEITPDVVFRINDGMLVSSNRGEFGGELIHIDSEGKLRLLGDMRVEDIYKMPFGVVIVSGLAHMSTNISEIHLFKNGSLTKLFNLLSAPRSSWILQNGDLLINSPPTGSQVLTNEGTLKRVRCSTSN